MSGQAWKFQHFQTQGHFMKHRVKRRQATSKRCRAVKFIPYSSRAGCQFSFATKLSLIRHCLIPSVSSISCPSQFFINVRIMPDAAWFERHKIRSCRNQKHRTEFHQTGDGSRPENSITVVGLNDCACLCCSAGKKVGSRWIETCAPERVNWIPPGLTQFRSCWVMLHEEATECQLNELAPFWRTIPVLSNPPPRQVKRNNAGLSTETVHTVWTWTTWDTLSCYIRLWQCALTCVLFWQQGTSKSDT